MAEPMTRVRRPRRHERSFWANLWDTETSEFTPALLDIEEAPRAPIKRMVIWGLVALFVAIFGWAWFGKLAVFAEAPGRIQVIGRSKVIEPQRVGTVLKVAAHDGDKVKEGDLLVQLDPTDAQASQTQYASQLADLRGEIARWPVEIARAHAETVDPDTLIDWAASTPAAVRQRENQVLRADLARLAATLADLQAQRQLLQAKADGITADISAAQAELATLMQQIAMIEQLAKDGWNSEARLLETESSRIHAQLQITEMQASLAETRAQIPVVESQMVDAREQLTKSGEVQLAALERQADVVAEKLAEASQTLAYMTLRSPVAGTVEASTLTTIGQVVKPGQQLMLVVPTNQPIEIQAYVPNSYIGFVTSGQQVNIKVQPYLYVNYGMVPGTITRAATNEQALLQRNTLQVLSLDGAASAQTTAQDTGSLAFPITVVPKVDWMMIDGRKMPLTPGMAVTVDVLAERRQLLDYVISPLIELFWTTAHER
jgi:hemolysin D